MLTRLGRLCLAAGLAISAGSMIGLTPPEPEPIPRRWQLEIEPGPLRLTTINVDKVGKKSYFYFTYKVINNSGEDLLFTPSFELSNGDEVLRSGRDVPGEVTKNLMESVQNSFVEDQITIIGQLLQGKENAKYGLVIWPATTISPDELTLYAAGFSGETATVEKPTNHEKVVLRKSYMIKYDVPGDMSNQQEKDLQPAEPPRWIMR